MEHNLIRTLLEEFKILLDMSKKMLIFFVGVLIGGMMYMFSIDKHGTDDKAKSYVVKEATNIATKHFYENQKEEVIFNQHKFGYESMDIIYLFGYLKENPEEKREIVLAYNNDYAIVFFAK